MANMGCILPRDGYLQRLRELTHEYGALLILDEVVTGFRYAPGGCQEYYGITPDISTFGKALGAGFPVGAVAGPRAILDRMRWSEHMVLHYGTFNGHRLTMKVIAANLDLLAARGTRIGNCTALATLPSPACGKSFAAGNRRDCAGIWADVSDLLHRPRQPSTIIATTASTLTRKVLTLRSRAARSRYLHDSFERIALDYFHGAHRRGRGGVNCGGGAGVYRSWMTDSQIKAPA